MAGDETLESYEMELSDSAEKVALGILRDGLVEATQSLVNLVQMATSEKLRFEAARYVVERNLGPINRGTGEKSQWEDLFEKLGTNDVDK